MQIEYQGHKRRRQKAREIWVKFLTDYQNGLSAEEIAKKYINPKTGEPYSRQHVYLILKKFKNNEI